MARNYVLRIFLLWRGEMGRVRNDRKHFLRESLNMYPLPPFIKVILEYPGRGKIFHQNSYEQIKYPPRSLRTGIVTRKMMSTKNSNRRSIYLIWLLLEQFMQE